MTRLLLRLLPVVCGGLLVTAALVRLTHARITVFWGAFALAAIGIVMFALIKGRAAAVTDAGASQLDHDAALDGELRSAHWFASHPVSNAWTAFHLERAADRVDAVSWPSVYPPVKSARALAGSAVLAAAAIAVVLTSAWPSAKGVATIDGRTAPNGKIVAGLPSDLQKQIDELIKAVQSGAMPMDAARAKVAELRDALANMDPKTQAALAKAAADQMKNGGKDGSSAKDPAGASLADRAEKAANTPFLPQDMKWSMEDLASKLKYSGLPKERGEGEEGQQSKAPNAPGEKGAAPQADAAMQMTRSTSTDAQSSQMMATTMSPGFSERGANTQLAKKDALGTPLDLAGLRKETIQADTDSTGANVLTEMRKKSEQSHSALGFSRVAPLQNYDKSHATAPPPPADALRPLLKQYFIRK